MMSEHKASPKAAKRLVLGTDATAAGSYGEWEDQMGETDCPEGCYVEPDGVCPHGYLSAGRTAGII